MVFFVSVCITHTTILKGTRFAQMPSSNERTLDYRMKFHCNKYFWMNYEITCHSAGEGAQACREGRKKASVLHTPPQTSAGAAAAGRSSTHAFIDPVSPIIAKKIIR